MLLRVFGTLAGAVLGAPLGIFAKSGRILSIGVDKPVPRDFQYIELRRALICSIREAPCYYGELFIVHMKGNGIYPII